MPRTASSTSPVVDAESVTFRLDDPHGRLKSARLVDEIGLDGPTHMTRARGHWSVRMPLPNVDRMEYLFEIEDHNGGHSTITDPANPRRVGGAFGEKSEATFPGYRQPEWLGWPADEITEQAVELDAGPRRAGIGAVLWQPASLGLQPAPLVVVHDGPEYAALGALTRYLGGAVASGTLPPVRAALLSPGDRNASYSASPSYTRGLRHALLSLDAQVPSTLRVGLGVSLGGLAMLYAHRSFPGLLDALFLQSSSFFTPALDPQERGFSRFRAITTFVAQVHASAPDGHPVPAVLTCGTAEENLTNNRAMAATLLRLGYPVRMVEVRDAHNYTAWRDALHPHFAVLVSELVSDRAA